MGERKLRGALFDMDGTLLDTEVLARASFLEAAGTFSLEKTQADRVFLTLVGTSETDTREKLHTWLPQRVSVDAFGEKWVAAMRAAVAQGIPLKPGVSEVLTTLQLGGVPMAVVTSSRSAVAEKNLSATGLRDYFTAIIGGDSVSANKPDPEPYVLGAAALGLSPAECAAFEDSDAGTLSAVRAGCATWQVPDLRPKGSIPPQIGQVMAETLTDAVIHAGITA